MNEVSITDEFPMHVFGSENKLTFAGVLSRFFYQKSMCDPICADWKADRTLKGYIRDYNYRLLPNLPKNKAIEDYDDEDFANAVKGLRLYNRRYADTTIQHYRWLFWKVYKAGLDNNLYEDKLFWELTGKTGNPEKSEEDLKAKRELARKSLSVPEELKLLNWFGSLDPEKADGEQIGLCLMFFMGLRNNEACGVNYGDLQVLSESNAFHCLYITKTTSIGSSMLKVGGKTSNSARILPVFDFLADFILARKKKIGEMVDNGSIEIPKAFDSSLDSLPIVCRKGDYLSRSSSSDLTFAGKKLFLNLAISNELRSASLQDELFKQKLQSEMIGEKEPTTYLFRRNFGTHLYHLGLSSGEIQYLIGHEVEAAEENRNFFTNEDSLARINQKMKAHPYYVFFAKQKPDDAFHFITSETSSVQRFLVYLREPMDVLSIQQAGSEPRQIKISIRDMFLFDGLSRMVDTHAIVNSVFYDIMKSEEP